MLPLDKHKAAKRVKKHINKTILVTFIAINFIKL